MIARITVDAGIHFGKPGVAGTRMTVQGVLQLINEGLTFQEIIENYYPDLTVEDIRAGVSYAIALVSGEDIHLTAASASGSCSIKMSTPRLRGSSRVWGMM